MSKRNEKKLAVNYPAARRVKPANSRIVENPCADGIDLQWRNPDSILFRWFIGLSNIIVFSMWYLAAVAALTFALEKLQTQSSFDLAEVIWGGLWLVLFFFFGGVLMPKFILEAIKGSGTEQISIRSGMLFHKPGGLPLYAIYSSRYALYTFLWTRSSRLVSLGELENVELMPVKDAYPGLNFWKRPSAAGVPGTRWRLSFQHKGRVVEVGAYLDEVDVQWLHDSLQSEIAAQSEADSSLPKSA